MKITDISDYTETLLDCVVNAASDASEEKPRESQRAIQKARDDVRALIMQLHTLAGGVSPIIIPDPKVYACQNCEWEGPHSALGDIKNYSQRVEPGEPEPDGECPKCGCLCHEKESAK